MEKKPGPLPPLQSLRAFESAARLCSFTRAAEELSVTQGAISRQIRNLEERLGVQLFRRAERGVHLTEAGEHYRESVRDALDAIAEATARLPVLDGAGPVTIGATSALASLWLMPRLAGFRQREPDLEIRVLASDHDFSAPREDVDLLITYARTTPTGADVRHLFDEVVFPVSAPEYPGDRVLREAADLLAETLLVLDDDHPDWIGWESWFRNAGLTDARPRRVIRVNSYPMLLQAAIAGQGVALGWARLVDDLINAGTLIQTLPERMPAPGAFYLHTLHPIPADTPAERLRDWLVQPSTD